MQHSESSCHARMLGVVVHVTDVMFSLCLSVFMLCLMFRHVPDQMLERNEFPVWRQLSGHVTAQGAFQKMQLTGLIGCYLIESVLNQSGPAICIHQNRPWYFHRPSNISPSLFSLCLMVLSCSRSDAGNGGFSAPHGTTGAQERRLPYSQYMIYIYI